METPECVKSLGICVLYHKETYEGKRYIDAKILQGYKMVLDFNMAYYPPARIKKNSSAHCLHGKICWTSKFEPAKGILNKLLQRGELVRVYYL
jgi:hypothetical protein